MRSFENLVRPFHSPKDHGGTWSDAALPVDQITPDFFRRPASELARDLLGRRIVSTIGGIETAGLIVETQAYTGAGDLESHPYRGVSSKSADWKPGSLYIYTTQGYAMLTFATAPYSEGATVLIRALEPVAAGVSDMIDRHSTASGKQKITQGPGLLTRALGISADRNGTNIFEDNGIQLEAGLPVDDGIVVAGKRLNCRKNPDPLLRFYISENEWVTKPR